METNNCPLASPEIPKSITPVNRTGVRRRTSGLLLALILIATCASSVPAMAIVRCCANPKKPTTTSLKASATSIDYGKKVTLTATVSPSNATGDVTFYSGSKELGKSPIIAGVAKLTTTSLPGGEDNITAEYDGSSKYKGSKSKTVTIHVKGGSGCHCIK